MKVQQNPIVQCQIPGAPPGPRLSEEARLAIVAIAAMAVAGGLACLWDLALIWDGGAHFCYTLFHGSGYGYAARFFTAILWRPVIWAAHLTDNLAILRALFGLPLCLAPAVSAALSWWMVARSRPALFPWALLGICAASVPVQVFVVNESIFQLNVFWPVFLGLLVPLTPARRIVMAGLLVFQFSHPQGLLLLAGAATALAALREEPMHRRRALIMAALTMLCLLRVLLFPDAEAAHQASLNAAFALFRQGMFGWPLAGWLCVVVAARTRTDRRATFFLGLAAALWVFWAADPERWVKALDARRFVPALAAPFFYGAWRSLRSSASAEWVDMWRRGLLVALIFATTLTLQANEWRRLMDRVIAQVEADPRGVVAVEDFAWLNGGPAEHWGLGAQVIAKLGGRKLVVRPAAREALRREPPLVDLGYDAWVPPEPGALGWFDFRAALQGGRSVPPLPGGSPERR